MAKISIIIVNYNTKNILKDCLENLKASKADFGEDLEIIVVDNASSDGSATLVKESYPDVILIESENNGIAAAHNLALTKASGDYFLFMGIDAFPSKEDLTDLMSFMNRNLDVGVVTPKLVLRDGSLDMDAHRGFPTPWASFTYFTKLCKLFPKSKLFNSYFLGYRNFSKPHEIDLCISHFMFVRVSTQQDVGPWDEEFFVYGEDVDFCYRVKSLSWKIIYLPDIEVLHLKGVSVGTRKESKDVTTASEETKDRMKQETTRAMRLFYEKHMMKRYPGLVNFAVLKGIDLLEFIRTL